MIGAKEVKRHSAELVEAAFDGELDEVHWCVCHVCAVSYDVHVTDSVRRRAGRGDVLSVCHVRALCGATASHPHQGAGRRRMTFVRATGRAEWGTEPGRLSR